MDTTFLPALCCFGPASVTLLYFMLKGAGRGAKKIATPVATAFTTSLGIGLASAAASYVLL
jgi:hypothetical protein